MRRKGAALTLLAALLASSCASSGTANDPFEPMNRKVFWFNEKFDHYLFEPVARGYDWVAPDPVERSIQRFFRNLVFPVDFLNNLLQGKPKDALEVTGRFVVNTTVGVAGLFDPATHWGLEAHREDFGQTLGVWGLGQGPYLVLPLLGPSSMRDAPGLAVDGYTGVTTFFLNATVLFASYGLHALNERSLALDLVSQARHAALDYYVFVRNAYLQRRQAAVEDRTAATDEKPPAEDHEDLYEDVTQDP